MAMNQMSASRLCHSKVGLVAAACERLSHNGPVPDP